MYTHLIPFSSGVLTSNLRNMSVYAHNLAHIYLDRSWDQYLLISWKEKILSTYFSSFFKKKFDSVYWSLAFIPLECLWGILYFFISCLCPRTPRTRDRGLSWKFLLKVPYAMLHSSLQAYHKILGTSLQILWTDRMKCENAEVTLFYILSSEQHNQRVCVKRVYLM